MGAFDRTIVEPRESPYRLSRAGAKSAMTRHRARRDQLWQPKIRDLRSRNGFFQYSAQPIGSVPNRDGDSSRVEALFGETSDAFGGAQQNLVESGWIDGSDGAELDYR